MSLQKSSVLAGQILRQARERHGLTLLDLQLDEVMTMANLSKIERGLVTPSNEKLEAILDALGVSFNERQDILKSFGYLPPYPLPDHAETEAIRQRCQPVLDELPLPAYLVDIITRLVTWNNLFAKLAGSASGALAQLRGKPLFKAQFASRLRLGQFMENMDEVLLEDVYSIRVRLAPYHGERWYQDFIAELCEEPDFQHYWDASALLEPREPAPVAFATRILHPVRFQLPDTEGAVLTFYSNPEYVEDDARFQMIYLIAENAYTMRQVERWRSE
jgi:transcriptional regulator with XRE-family HTH domain